jgi:hypothetical protein
MAGVTASRLSHPDALRVRLAGMYDDAFIHKMKPKHLWHHSMFRGFHLPRINLYSECY